MTDVFKGGCACGAVGYEIEGEPLFQNHCQCRQCQQISGTGHGSYLTFTRDAATLTGDFRTWEAKGDSGQTKARSFCGQCGSPVFIAFEAAPHLIAIHAASLNEPERFQPQVVTYASRGLAWDHLDARLKIFDTMPA